MENAKPHNEGVSPFAKELVDAQFELYAYILVLMDDSPDAQDVLQETNLQILGTDRPCAEIHNFLAWAKTLARFQVKTWRARQSRDHLVLDDELFDELVNFLPDNACPMDDRTYALSHCLKRLPPKVREYFLERYMENIPVQEIARRERRSVDGLSVTLHRIRLALRDCIRKTITSLNREGSTRHE